MTNGEKFIKDYYPNSTITRDSLTGRVFVNEDNADFTLPIEWWDAEYKEPTTKNDLGVDREQLKTMIRGLTKWYVKRDNTEVGEPNTAVGLLYDDVMFGIDRLPSVTSIRPKGHWIDKHHLFESCSAECSSCHKRSNGYAHDNGFSLEYKYFDFCPKCGSDNREVEE